MIPIDIQTSGPTGAPAGRHPVGARKEIELAIRLPTAKDELPKVLALLAAHAVGVRSHNTYHDRDRLVLLAITDAPSRAQAVLHAAGYSCQADDVVLVHVAPDCPGIVARLGRQLRQAGIDLLRSHLSATGSDGSYAVFKTSNNHQALHVLNDGESLPTR